MDEAIEVTCPHCGEIIAFEVDVWGGASQSYVEDCSVCCRPLALHVVIDEDGDPVLTVARLDS